MNLTFTTNNTGIKNTTTKIATSTVTTTTTTPLSPNINNSNSDSNSNTMLVDANDHRRHPQQQGQHRTSTGHNNTTTKTNTADDIYGPVAKSMMMEMMMNTSNPNSPTMTKTTQRPVMRMAASTTATSPTTTATARNDSVLEPQQQQLINMQRGVQHHPTISSSSGDSVVVNDSNKSPRSPRMATVASNTNNRGGRIMYNNNNHGRKPSLVGFDPFSSSPPNQQQQQQQQHTSCLSINASANAFDSTSGATSPTTGYRNTPPRNSSNNNSAATTPIMNYHHSQQQQQQQQHVYPFSPTASPQLMMMMNNSPSTTLTPNSTTTITTPKEEKKENQQQGVGTSPASAAAVVNDTFHENTLSPSTTTPSSSPNKKGASRASKTFNKFLRKASLVKSKSLGKVGVDSNNGSSTKNNNNNKNDNNPVLSAAAAAATINSPKSPKMNKFRRVSMPNTSSSFELDATNTNKASVAQPPVVVAAAVVTAEIVSPTAPNGTTTNGDTSDGNQPTSSSSSSSSVRELMEMKDTFSTLTMPTLNMLTKPSPTSFLTGKTEEAVRTSEYEPSPYQLEIPSLSEIVTIARLNEFVDTYRTVDQNLELSTFTGLNRIELQQKAHQIPEHIPIVQAILECGDNEISIEGFISDQTAIDTHHSDDRLEAVVFHGQRYFIVVFRGTTEQQNKILGTSKSKKRAVSIDETTKDMKNVEVYSGFKDGYTKLERKCFTLLDKLTEDHPFCDVVFTGYSYGAAIATLSAFRYATARPMMRVGCFPLGSPKVGFSHFRHVVNSLQNLKVMRIELGQDSKCQGPTTSGWHVGHTLVLSSGSTGAASSLVSSAVAAVGTSAAAASTIAATTTDPQKKKKNDTSNAANNTTQSDAVSVSSSSSTVSVHAYRFDTPKYKHNNHKFWKTTNPDLKKYLSLLEDMTTSKIPWAKDFTNISGEGVVVNNESRDLV